MLEQVREERDDDAEPDDIHEHRQENQPEDTALR
jgi:hypothetical protein